MGWNLWACGHDGHDVDGGMKVLWVGMQRYWKDGSSLAQLPGLGEQESYDAGTSVSEMCS